MQPIREAELTRSTRETRIRASFCIDGTGVADVNTGVGFFDHMLEQLARHGLFNITLHGEGDRHIDDHHLVEDCGIVLGAALAKALGDATGITRYASVALPMDETLVEAAVDVCKRPFLVWNMNFPQAFIGTFQTELLPEFFRAFAFNAGIGLHLNLRYGTNTHHIAEAAFKATARVLRAALTIDPRSHLSLPSTKGHLGL